ncbi:hypothetical protein KBA73_02475 [Patescibacteria group bacterium]|nr:hypothetical protein [Patescibacteria group bacterium]
MASFLTTHIEHMEGGQLTLKTDDGQTLRIPESFIQGTPVIGAELRLLPLLAGSEATQNPALAQALLNELLGPTP